MKSQAERDTIIESILERHKDEKGNVITLLQEIQDAFGYIPEDTVDLISRRFEIPESKLYGVSTFYAQFHLRPRGENIITACCGTACHVKGAERIISSIRNTLRLDGAEDTTNDGNFTIEKVACIGTCSMAPVVIINKKVYGSMTPDKITKILKKSSGEKEKEKKER